MPNWGVLRGTPEQRVTMAAISAISAPEQNAGMRRYSRPRREKGLTTDGNVVLGTSRQHQRHKFSKRPRSIYSATMPGARCRSARYGPGKIGFPTVKRRWERRPLRELSGPRRQLENEFRRNHRHARLSLSATA